MIEYYKEREYQTQNQRVILLESTTTGLMECFISTRLTAHHPWGPWIKAEKV